MLTSSLSSNVGTGEATGRCPQCLSGISASPSNCMLKAPEPRHSSRPLAPPS